jgi:hypothetical protein
MVVRLLHARDIDSALDQDSAEAAALRMFDGNTVVNFAGILIVHTILFEASDKARRSLTYLTSLLSNLEPHHTTFKL